MIPIVEGLAVLFIAALAAIAYKDSKSYENIFKFLLPSVSAVSIFLIAWNISAESFYQKLELKPVRSIVEDRVLDAHLIYSTTPLIIACSIIIIVIIFLRFLPNLGITNKKNNG